MLLPNEIGVCSTCFYALPVTSFHLTPHKNELVNKLIGLCPVKQAFAYLRFTKGGMSQKILHAIKYKDNPELATYLGHAYGTLVRNQGNPLKHIDALVPVPLHPKKLAMRGYNQSQALAEGLQQALHIPIVEGLVRTQHSLSQTKKNRMERLEAVNKIFQAQANVQGKHLLLIDDVMTTGATLIACMNSLVQQGAKSVDVFVLAAGR